MKSYVCLYLTSNQCGHCAHVRGDGVINNGKEGMSHKYINSLFESIGNNKLKILNINYQDMSGRAELITDISMFERRGKNYITQDRCFKDGDNTKKTYIVSNRGRNKKRTGLVKKNRTEDVSWYDFIRGKIARQLINYIFYFPCFLVLESENWKKCLNDPNQNLIALTNAGETIKMNNFVGLDKDSKSLGRRNVEIRKLLNNIAEGKSKIEYIDRNIDVEKTETKNNTFIIKNYDD